MIDFNLDEGSPVKSRDIDLIIQQIDILFDTIPDEVLGEDFGTRYDLYLYKLRLSTNELKNQVLSDINSLQLFDFIPKVEVYLLQGTEQDIALIQITLTREMEEYEKIYKITS